MIEILNTIYLILFSLILFRFKLNDKIILYFFGNIKFSLVDTYSFNILIFLLVLFFLSFFNFNQAIFVYALFCLSVIFLILGKKNIFTSKLIINKDLFLIFVFTFIISINLITNLKLEWDGHFWYFKALNFYEDLSFFNLENTSNNHYPHLGGIIWGLFWKISLLNHEFYGRIIYIFIYVLSIFCLVEKISNNFNIRLLISILLFFLTFDHFLFGGYQAYLLFSLIIIIFNLLSKLNLKNLNYLQLVFLILSSYLLAWVKNEGVFYFSFIIFYIIYLQSFNKKIFSIILFFLLIFLRIFLFSKISDFTFASHASIDLSLNDLFYKLFLISKHIAIAMFKHPIWILIFFSLFIKKIEKNEFYIIYFTAISSLFVYFIYLKAGTHNLDWYIAGSLDRLLFHISGFYMMFLSYRLKYFCEKFSK